MPSWDQLYADPTVLPIPEQPEPLVVDAMDRTPPSATTRVLDVGCGAGRHLAWLERRGYAAHGIDSARQGLLCARARLQGDGHPVRVALADMRALPFPRASFAAVISHHVLYHGTRADLELALSEVERVLQPGGVFVATLLSPRMWKHGEGRRLEPGTYVQARGPEAGVPHHYCDEPELRALLVGFELVRLALDERTDPDGRLHSHWQLVATRGARPGRRS